MNNSPIEERIEQAKPVLLAALEMIKGSPLSSKELQMITDALVVPLTQKGEGNGSNTTDQ